MNTEMSKQTAVQCLYDYLLHMNETREWRSRDLHIDKFHEAFKEAIAMEEGQLIEAFLDGYKSHPFMAKQYYDETYGGDK